MGRNPSPSCGEVQINKSDGTSEFFMSGTLKGKPEEDIQSALDILGDGDTVSLCPGFQYNITTGLSVPAGVKHATIDMRNATLKRDSSIGITELLSVDGTLNLRIRNGNIDGSTIVQEQYEVDGTIDGSLVLTDANPASRSNGIALDETIGTVLEDINIRNFSTSSTQDSNGLIITGPTSSVQMDNCTTCGMGQRGVYLRGGSLKINSGNMIDNILHGVESGEDAISLIINGTQFLTTKEKTFRKWGNNVLSRGEDLSLNSVFMENPEFANGRNYNNSLIYPPESWVFSGNMWYYTEIGVPLGAGAPTHTSGEVGGWVAVANDDPIYQVGVMGSEDASVHQSKLRSKGSIGGRSVISWGDTEMLSLEGTRTDNPIERIAGASRTVLSVAGGSINKSSGAYHAIYGEWTTLSVQKARLKYQISPLDRLPLNDGDSITLDDVLFVPPSGDCNIDLLDYGFNEPDPASDQLHYHVSVRNPKVLDQSTNEIFFEAITQNSSQ